jgi:hypothetical protein
MPSDKPLPRLYVDFNETLAPDLILLSRHDAKPDANGEMIHLYEGLVVAIFLTTWMTKGDRTTSSRWGLLNATTTKVGRNPSNGAVALDQRASVRLKLKLVGSGLTPIYMIVSIETV